MLPVSFYDLHVASKSPLAEQALHSLKDARSQSSHDGVTEQLKLLRPPRARPRASDEQMQRCLVAPNGAVRTRRAFVAAMNKEGVGADVSRITDHMQGVAGVQRQPPATDTQILANSYFTDGTPKSAESIAHALNIINLGAAPERITTLLKSVSESGHPAATQPSTS